MSDAITDLHTKAINQILTPQLLNASTHDVILALNHALLMEVTPVAAPMVLGADSGLPAWAQGAGMAATQFLIFYKDALHHELCTSDGHVAAPYDVILGGGDTQDAVRKIVPVVLQVVGASLTLVNPVVIAVLVALWIVKVGLVEWCKAGATA